MGKSEVYSRTVSALYLIFTFSMIRFSYSSCVRMPFSSSNSTRLASSVSRRSISSEGSRALHNHLLVNGYKPCNLGHNVWIRQNCILNSTDRLTIGNGVGIGTYSCVWTHGFFGELIGGCTIFKIAPVLIEDDVWLIGSFNVISPGITIGKRSVILTGSVVTKDVPPYACVAGNPAGT
jgi:acetyltransferase-like isoleucine patch superfamily enzyme